MTLPSQRSQGNEAQPAGAREPAGDEPTTAFDPVAFRQAIEDPDLMLELLELFDEDADDLLAADAWPRLVREIERLPGELRRFRDILSS